MPALGHISLLGYGERLIHPLRSMAPERMLLVELLAATQHDGESLHRWVGSFTASRSLADRFFAGRVRSVGSRALAQHAATDIADTSASR